MKFHDVLIVGGNRGLGLALSTLYATSHKTVHATARHTAPQTSNNNITWIPHIDITHSNAGRLISLQYTSPQIDVLVLCASYFAQETLSTLNYDKQVQMYKTTAIGPVFLVQELLACGLLREGSRVVFVGGESGSVGLRTTAGKGGNYGGHGSKAALNMVARVLSVELEAKGIAVAVVHTGYLRTQNGDGSFAEEDGPDAVKPEDAALSLRDWIADFDMSKTGQFWSVRGTARIAGAEKVMGKQTDASEAVQLPW